MKTKIYTLFILLISTTVYQASSQTVNLGSVNTNDQKVTFIKTIESRFIDNKVYLHITVNGNTETKMVAVERSLDATHFEVIGFINIYGNPYQSDISYYFTDELPVVVNLYYRLSYTAPSTYYESSYSEIISVIPFDENKTLADIQTPISNPNK